MRHALWSLLLLCACTAPETSRTSSPIIGGQPTAGEHPSAGVILTLYDLGGGNVFGTMTCTGTLIAPDVVMVAAHCAIDLFGGAIPSETFFSFQEDVSAFGMENQDLPPDAVPFAELVPHPDFDFEMQPPMGLGNYFDVGLGFLEAPITHVTPEFVADDQDGATLGVGTVVEIAGYGTTQPDGQEAGVKHHAVSFINEIAQFEMQIGDVPPGDPQKCHGDSGGPSYVEIQDGRGTPRRVIGITSRAYGQKDCNEGGVDMRADAFRPWLDQTMRDRCTAGARPVDCTHGGGGLPLPGGTFPPPNLDAGVMPDTGPPPMADAGFVDAGAPDAGAKPDAGAVDTGVLAPTPTPTSNRNDRGCGCSTAASGNDGKGFLCLLMLVLACRPVQRRQDHQRG